MGFSIRKGARDGEEIFFIVPDARVTIYEGEATATSLDVRYPNHVTVVIDEGQVAAAAPEAEEASVEAEPTEGEESSSSGAAEE